MPLRSERCQPVLPLGTLDRAASSRHSVPVRFSYLPSGIGWATATLDDGLDVRVGYPSRRPSRLGALALLGLVFVSGCSGKYYWIDVRIESIQGSVVCFQAVDPRIWQNYPPDGRACMDATGVDLSAIVPGSCVAAEVTAGGPEQIHAVGRDARPCG